MMWMVILSFCIFASYVAVMAVKYGAKEVVSEYAYEGGMTLFTACIGASAALLMPVMIAVAPENWKFLGFLAAAALIFVAVAPHYKGDEAKLHKTAAKVAGARRSLGNGNLLGDSCFEPCGLCGRDAGD